VTSVLENKMHHLPRTRLGLAVAISLLLNACATMPGSTETAASAPAPQTPVVRASASSALPALENTVIAQDLTRDINSEGRVIQLGRIGEVPPVGNPPSNDVVELNYEQEDLRLVFQQLGDAMGINMVIDPSIDFKVSVRTSANNPLRYDDIWPLLRLLAANAGVSIRQVGNVYEFRRDPSNVPVEILLPQSLNQATASQVLQVTPLKYISVDAALTILNPLLQPQGRVIQLGAGNVLGISGSPEELARVNALLSVVDDDPFQNQGIQLYQLNNSKAVDVAQELGDVLKLIEGEQPAYEVLGLERVNALLVIAPATRGFDEVTKWVKLLDAESQEQVEQLFVYRVKNLDAVALGSTLNNVFSDNGDEEQVRPAGRDQNDNPFASPLVAGEAAPENASEATTANSNAVSANLSVTIVSDEDTNSLLVRASPREYRQLLTTISSLDTVPAQVLIHAVIGQVTLTDSTQFGIDWSRVSGNIASGPARLSSSFLPSGIIDTSSGLAAQGSGLVLTRSYMDGSAVIDATLNAIAEDNEVRLLARPTILATNKQEGAINVGQKVPVNNGVTVVGNGVTTANIAYTDVGIELTITPQINDDGYINLQIHQKLSSIEEGGSTGVADNPTFTNQEITTTVVVADQSTITLGGLIQEEASDQQKGIPFLQKIPVAGRVFSYTDNKSVRRELFVILRPQIIFGDARDSATLAAFRDKFTQVKKLFDEAGL